MLAEFGFADEINQKYMQRQRDMETPPPKKRPIENLHNSLCDILVGESQELKKKKDL